MTAEKLAKHYLTSADATAPPEFSHAAVVWCLQSIKRRRDIWSDLGFSNARGFAAYIDSVLPFAGRIERFAPNYAGRTQPNAEYPWQPTPEDDVVAPCDYEFLEFDASRPQIIRFVEVLESLMRIAR